MKVGLLGGTFDPIHNGHVKLASAALKQLRLDRVYLVVSPRSPFKLGKKSAPPAARLALVRLALRGRPGLAAADWEFRRRGPSYTVATLRAYRRRRPHDELTFIVGSDALAGLPRWKDAAAIVKMARVAAGRRPGAAWPALPPAISGRVVKLKGVFPDVSATALRAAIAAGRRPMGLAPAVFRRIRERGLYR